MKNYVFRCMVDDENVGDEYADIFYVEIEAHNIIEARQLFQERMKKNFQCGWCLTRVYREV